MVLGACLLVGLAVGAAAGGWWVLAGIVLAGMFAALAATFPRGLRVVVLLALAAMVARTFAAYLFPGRAELAALGVIALATVVAASGGDVGTLARRIVTGVALVAAAGFVALGFAIDPVGFVPAQELTPEPLVFTPRPAGVLTSAVALVAIFTVLDSRLRRRAVVARIAVGTVAAFAVAWAALHQLGPFRLGLSDTPLRDALAAADAASLNTMLNAVVVVITLPALLALLAAARDELGTVIDGPPVRFAVVAGVVTALMAALLTARVALLVASTIAVSAAVFGWVNSWLTRRRMRV
ncbi:MAG: hypothetical protein GEU86_06790 [Actinophytocola sp.]|nr:hypothetical protein [Actinophytocola sp.]